MGMRQATREDLLKLLKSDFDPFILTDSAAEQKKDENKIKIYHSDCKRGRIIVPNGINLFCKKCHASWGKDRPNTWTEQEIAAKFWVETPVDGGTYVLKRHETGYHFLTEAPEKAEEAQPAKKKSQKAVLLDKIKQAIGRP